MTGWLAGSCGVYTLQGDPKDHFGIQEWIGFNWVTFQQLPIRVQLLQDVHEIDPYFRMLTTSHPLKLFGPLAAQSRNLAKTEISSGNIIERLAEVSIKPRWSPPHRMGGTIMRLWRVLQWRWGCNWAHLLLCCTTLYKKESTVKHPASLLLHSTPFIVPMCTRMLDSIYPYLPTVPLPI